MDYDSHPACMDALKKAQEADQDNREKAQEAHNFVDARGGQWEDGVLQGDSDKPQYTFDQTNAIIDQIYGQMKRTDYDITVRPESGKATKDIAATYDGMVRNIENVSNADTIYNLAGRNMITAGIDGWEVVNKYVDGDSFDQDLVIQKIPDFINRCWLGPHTEPDGSDAQVGWVLEGLDTAEFEKKFPGRSTSASVDTENNAGHQYYHRHDLVFWGQFRYLKEESREIVRMSNGKVYEVNDDFETIVDDLANLGVTEVERRKRPIKCMYTRRFDANGWIDDKPTKTIFRHWLNIIPCYAHFKITDKSKLIYWGAVEKLMDPQRVYNYSLSREIEEGALAARKTMIVTPAMVEGFEDEWEGLNVEALPYLRRNLDSEMPELTPQETGGPQINQGLRALSEGMAGMMNSVAGLYATSMGDNPNAQSGVAIDKLMDRGDAGNSIYIEGREISQCHTGRILVDAIPRVYKQGRQQRILNPDGSYEMAMIGDPVRDERTGEVLFQYDLSEGKYDVVCQTGPGYKTRQSQTLATFDSLAQYVPGLLESNADIILNNTDAPGMDKAAERVRRSLFMSGAIPPSQMTEEELAEFQAMQEMPPQESPEMVLARAEEGKAQADLIEQQNKQAQIQADFEVKKAEIALKQEDQRLRKIELAVEAEKVGAEIKGIGAKAARDIAEAEAQDIENDATKAGITSLAEVASGG